MGNVHFNVICLGAGGTGGNFVKEFARYAAYLNKSTISISLSLVDGDKIEEKNCSRQPFSYEEVALNKAVSLVDTIQEVLNMDNVYAYPNYIDSTKDLSIIAGMHECYRDDSEDGRDLIILIGCVDNHRARQVMNDFFYSTDNIVYIDSANEFSVGEICIGARINGKTIAPPRSYYFPDILTDTSPSASEKSCEAINISSPQHIATNLMAAHLLLSVVTNIISCGKMDLGMIFFDSLIYYSKFIPYAEYSKKDKINEKGGEDNGKSKTNTEED